MSSPRLEEVFKLSGVPTYTFVKPSEYNRLLIAMRTPGRGVVIEGPSGIGKTSAVTRALEGLGVSETATRLSARKPKDIPFIAELVTQDSLGTVIIDDFHRLEEGLRQRIADFLKVLADEERTDTKLIVVGINKVGESLVRFASDVLTRVDVIPFEANPPGLVREVAALGEAALNIRMNTIDEIVEAANGSFFIVQMLCHETCLHAGVTEREDELKEVCSSFEVIRSKVLANLGPKFLEHATKFAKGPTLRRAGRAPYLHILKWLAEANSWSIELDREMVKHPEHRGGVGQVVDKGYLANQIASNHAFSELLHYEPSTRIFTAQDPQFVFFLRNIDWNKFAERVGYINLRFPSRYDFALSFAGPDREVAEKIFNYLTVNELAVFYDKNEQARILAEDVEEYLAPIYRSEAAYVVCLLGPEYPKRIWTKFESEQFRQRFGERSVIPIWFTTAPTGLFDESTRVGGISFNPMDDVEAQIQEIGSLLVQKISDHRLAPGPVVDGEEVEPSLLRSKELEFEGGLD